MSLDAAPLVLPAYWILATSAALVASLPMQGMQTFRHAVLLSAARGKLWEDRPAVNLGPLTNAAVPQSWFAHFYAVGAACNFACVSLYASWLDPKAAVSQAQWASLLALAALQLHLLRRWYETVFVMKYPHDAKMHVIAYIFGLSYYIVLSVSQLPPADLQRMLLQPQLLTVGLRSALNFRPQLSVTASQMAVTVLGLLVFLGGNALQNHSHKILAGLSSRSAQHAGKIQPYRIPHGGAFDRLSCPHYLGEIVIYIGLLLLQHGCSLNAWLILLWVVCNLVLAAKATHEWYGRKFEEYPKTRWALVPYLY